LGEPVGKNTLGHTDQRHCWPDVFICRELLAQPHMIMAFLLVMLVEGEQVAGRFHFRNIHRCNQFAYWLEQGTIKPIEGRRLNNQENITAYCIPVKVPPNTAFYD